MIKNILHKMRYESKHGHFLHFKDGDMSNDNYDNLEYISIVNFFRNRALIDSTDWTWGLDKNECKYVIQHFEDFQLFFKY
ncbi:MAG: hypothetical protein CL470_05890 [Acidimicrobiaceae bacterium]|nr:hypothetical protein [Acidimicrobiaceae bacterium]|tara:strand:+ start:836 stop:1075 length:240 start_codon:yes stop_codon:yes gene_type:complete